MAQQVKFYSVATLPATPNVGGVYFVNNGELYKGSQRFGLGRVTVAASTASIEGAARGDIVVTGSGAGWVYDGSAWQSIGGDIASLTSAWRSDIKTWTSGLATSGEDKYITGITQAEDGKVTAQTSTFSTDVKAAIGNGSASGTANGITVSVVTTSGSVTGVQVAAADLSVNSIYANDATFDATTVTASTLTVGGDENSFTVGGKTIPDFIDNAIGGLTASTVTASANGIEVGVTTQSGKVTGVSVSANAITAESGTFENLTVTDTATFSATTVSADTLTIGGSTVEQLADKQIAAIAESTVTSTATGITVGVTTKGGSVTAVSLNAESFANAMHFLGVGTVEKTASGVNVTPPAGKTPVAGDIVIDSTSGLEAICTGTDPSTTWELIGDNAVYALNAYSSTATVYAGVETVPGALNAAGAAIDALKTKTDAYVGGSASDADQGVSVTVSVDATTLAPSVDVVVTSSTLFAGLDANVSSSENNSIKVGVTQVDGKVTGVTADILWLDAEGAPLN